MFPTAFIAERRMDWINEIEKAEEKEGATAIDVDFYNGEGCLIWWITSSHRINCGGNWLHRIWLKKSLFGAFPKVRINLTKLKQDIFNTDKKNEYVFCMIDINSGEYFVY